MATILMDTDIDIIDRYTKLMQSSVGAESIYIRTKDTLETLFKKS